MGQHCTASLNCGLDPSSYSWTVDGNTFQYWSSDTHANGNNSYNSDASYYVGGHGPLTNPTAGWYWNDLQLTQQEPVSCTATVTPPAGQGSAFSVTATKDVTVYRPNWTATGTGGNMQVSASYPFGNGTDYWLYAGSTANTPGVFGMNFQATVTSPNSSLFGDGSLLLVQLGIPNRSYTTNVAGFIGTHADPENGQEGLDTSYPASWTQGAPNYGNNDNPGFNLTSMNAVSAQLSDQFEDYLMYFAPGSSQAVPLAYFVWSVNGNVAIPSTNNWANYGTGSPGAVTPSGTATAFGASNSFPMWTLINHYPNF